MSYRGVKCFTINLKTGRNKRGTAHRGQEGWKSKRKTKKNLEDNKW